MNRSTCSNGLAFAANGDILISNFGTDLLEVMTREGHTRTLSDRIDGQPIGKVNFVLRDSKDRIWITASTRVNPWTRAAASRVRDGFIAVVEPGRGIRVVADGFYFTNEIRLDAREQWPYIVQTTGPWITRTWHDCAVDGQHHVWRRRPAYRPPRQPAGDDDPLFPCPGGRTADGALEPTLRRRSPKDRSPPQTLTGETPCPANSSTSRSFWKTTC